MKKTYKTDWLASCPIFYNEKTKTVNNNINDVIDFSNFEFDPEGFNNYLDFGYSILEQTPVRYVKFLRHSSCLTVHENGKLEVRHLEDPVEEWIGKTSHENDVLQLLHTLVRDWEKSVSGEIIIPTSGGYDSRLLNCLVENKSRIRSFTYGISEEQAESFEVVYAKKLSEVLGTKWEQIYLGDFHSYFDEWDRLFGISTHAHGMYHMEFYKKILPKTCGKNLLIGIMGDAFAGNVSFSELTSPQDIITLGYSHGLNATSKMSELDKKKDLIEKYFESNKTKLKMPIYRIVESMRLKIILLSYLLSVPEYFGFKPWSPYLSPEVALSMLTLPAKRRENRLWQKEFFKKSGVDFESMGYRASYQNNLDHQAMRRIQVKPLDVKLLREVIKPKYVEWINYHVGRQCVFGDWFCNRFNKTIYSRIYNRICKLFNVKEQRLSAYCAYLTLRPVQNLLEKRDCWRKGNISTRI
jgi:hypothetical protein